MRTDKTPHDSPAVDDLRLTSHDSRLTSHEIAISVTNLSKKYHLYDSPQQRLKEALHPFRKKYHREFWALKDVSFEVKKGETIGIIGQNGSGKSTLLQILCGVLQPTSGGVMVNGRISALLELGAGFNPEFTGRQNVYMNGALMGFTREQMDSRFDDIVSFADIGEFIDQPVKTYSSGMYVRLAFAAAINVDPDILVVDEALAVGDIRFQGKCYRKIKDFSEMNKTIFFVTHDLGAVRNYCSTAVWLKDGSISQMGDPDAVIKDYSSYMNYDLLSTPSKGDRVELVSAKKDDAVVEWDDASPFASFGGGGAEITGVALYLKKPFVKTRLIKGGEQVIFFITIKSNKDLISPIIGFTVNDRYGHPMFALNTHVLGHHIDHLGEGESVVVEFEFSFPKLANGEYTFSPAIAEGTQLTHMQHHWVHDAYVIQISNNHEAAKIGGYLVVDEAEVRVQKSAL